MSQRPPKVLRLTYIRPRGTTVGTVTQGYNKVIIKDPDRRIRRTLATLFVLPHAHRVRLEPHVTGMYLRRVNLQHGASYDVYNGMTFSFGPYKWKVDFINMNQLTRSHSRSQLSRRRRPSGRVLSTPTIPGIPHLRIYKSPEGSCFSDSMIWLPGPITGHTNEPERLLFFQTNQSPSVKTTTWAASHLYSPTRDFLSAVSSLPDHFKWLSVVVESLEHVRNLQTSVELLSTLGTVTKLVIEYDIHADFPFDIPHGRIPTGHLKQLTCNDVTDALICNVMRSFLQFNAGLVTLCVGGHLVYVVALVDLIWDRPTVNRLLLHLEAIENYAPLLNMIRAPHISLRVLHVTVLKMTDPAALRNLIESQATTLEKLSIAEDTPEDVHICNNICRFNFIPPAMPLLKELHLFNLTCGASAYNGILHLNANIQVTLTARPNDPFRLYNFFGGPLNDPSPSELTSLVVNSGRLVEALNSPLILQYKPEIWANLTTLKIHNVRLSDVNKCLRMAHNVKTLHVETLPPTPDDHERLHNNQDPNEVTIADYFFVGHPGPGLLKDCVSIENLSLSIGLPPATVSSVPAVGFSLFEKGLIFLESLKSFKSNAVSPRLMVTMNAFRDVVPNFHYDLTLHDSAAS